MPFVLRPKDEQDIQVIDAGDMDWLINASQTNRPTSSDLILDSITGKTVGKTLLK